MNSAAGPPPLGDAGDGDATDNEVVVRLLSRFSELAAVGLAAAELADAMAVAELEFRFIELICTSSARVCTLRPLRTLARGAETVRRLLE